MTDIIFHYTFSEGTKRDQERYSLIFKSPLDREKTGSKSSSFRQNEMIRIYSYLKTG
jgi:hypothetical protein